MAEPAKVPIAALVAQGARFAHRLFDLLKTDPVLSRLGALDPKRSGGELAGMPALQVDPFQPLSNLKSIVARSCPC